MQLPLSRWPDDARISRLPVHNCQWYRYLTSPERNLCATLEQRWAACRAVDARDVRHPRADEAYWQWHLAWRPIELHGFNYEPIAARCTEPCT